MGLLDKIFGKKEVVQVEPETINIKLDDLAALLKERQEAAHDEIMEDVEALVQEMMEVKGEVLEIIEDLKAKDFPKEIKDKVPKPVKTAKPKYIKAMGDAVKGIRVEKEGMEGYRSFHKKTMKTMKIIEKTQVGQGRFVAHSFEHDVLRIGGNLNRIIDAGGRVGEALLRDDENRESFSKAQAMADSIKGMSSWWSKGTGIIDNNTKEIETLKTEIQEAGQKIDELKSSKGYSELRAMKEDLAGVKDQRAAVRGEVFRKISPLGRVLRKYRKLLEGTPEGNEIDSYLKDSPGAFVQGVPLTPILDGLEKAMKGGHISLKDKEMAKMQQRLKDALETDFDGLDKKYNDTKQEADGIRLRIRENKIGRQITALEDEIEKKGARIGRMENEIRSKEKDLPGIDEKIETERSGLEDHLEDIMGGEVDLTI